MQRGDLQVWAQDNFSLFFLKVYFFISLQPVTYLLGSQKVSVSLRCLSLWWFYYIIMWLFKIMSTLFGILMALYVISVYVYCIIMKKPQSSYEVQVIHDWSFCRSQTVGLCGWLGVIMVVYIESHVCNCSKMLGSPWRLHHGSMCHVSKWVACYRDPRWGSSQGLKGASETQLIVDLWLWDPAHRNRTVFTRYRLVSSRRIRPKEQNMWWAMSFSCFHGISKKSCSAYRQMATVLEEKIFTASSQCFVTLLGRSVC